MGEVWPSTSASNPSSTLISEKRYPAAEPRVLYHECWEIELGFGEIKTEMLERPETIRSKSSTAVTQETWGCSQLRPQGPGVFLVEEGP